MENFSKTKTRCKGGGGGGRGGEGGIKKNHPKKNDFLRESNYM